VLLPSGLRESSWLLLIYWDYWNADKKDASSAYFSVFLFSILNSLFSSPFFHDFSYHFLRNFDINQLCNSKK